MSEPPAMLAGVAIEVRPATDFDDVRTMLGPRDPSSNVCYCLTYRLPVGENRRLAGLERAEAVRGLTEQDPPPGVLAYDGDLVVGWGAVHPRADTAFARSRTIPRVDDLDVWSIWCLRVRPGHRRQGVSHALLAGAVAFARDRGAPAIEGYPVDTGGDRIDQTMAYMGTRRLFESAGFVKASDTTSTISGHPRVVMRWAP